MGEIVHALLFDTRSIQRYIYAGNRLRTNIGASYLVDTVFTEELFPSVEDVLGTGSIDTGSWQSSLAVQKLSKSGQCVVAANGGGNALLLFSPDVTEATLTDIVRLFSERLLVSRPGLHIGVARGDIDMDAARFQHDLGGLFAQLKANQNNIFPLVNVPYTGLTLSCEVNGEAATFYDAHHEVSPSGGARFYSQEVAVKAKAAKKAALKLNQLDEGISAKYEFPLQIDQLGQRETENYFSIVHIDGNNMGEKFRACATQAERSHLSENVRRKTEGCFKRLLHFIDSEYESFADYLTLGIGDSGKPYIPIRPIIIGGDDVTFVCPAKAAISFARKFMEDMLDTGSVDGIDAKAARSMDCCAGIAIVKTSYPFFRGYELAEQLCDAAKMQMRAVREKDGAGTSWLDFAILHGEQAPTLDQIRAQEYSGARGDMHFGPYQVGHAMSSAPHSHRFDIEDLISAVHQMQDGCMAKNKAKEMRSVLQHGKNDAHRFMKQLEHMEQHIPRIEDWKIYAEPENDLWHNGRTPYVDAIEMMDFIPKAKKESKSQGAK